MKKYCHHLHQPKGIDIARCVAYMRLLIFGIHVFVLGVSAGQLWAQTCAPTPVILEAFGQQGRPNFPLRLLNTSDDLRGMENLVTVTSKVLTAQGVAANPKKESIVQNLVEGDSTRIMSQGAKICGIILSLQLIEEHKPYDAMVIELADAKLHRAHDRAFIVSPDAPLTVSPTDMKRFPPRVIARGRLEPQIWDQAHELAKNAVQLNPPHGEGKIDLFTEIYVPLQSVKTKLIGVQKEAFNHVILRSLGPNGSSTIPVLGRYNSFMVGAANNNPYGGQYYENSQDFEVQNEKINAPYDLIFSLVGFAK